MQSVVCCRTAPLQKAMVLRTVRRHHRMCSLAIGDGANDVSMIQCANVGIGISGCEGMQAAMSSDFSISHFRFLKPLLLVHGHWNYQRLASGVLFVYNRNCALSFILFCYQWFIGFPALSPINSYHHATINTLFLSPPFILYSIFNKDHTRKSLLDNPKLYSLGLHSEVYRLKTLLINIGMAAYIGAAIYFTIHLSVSSRYRSIDRLAVPQPTLPLEIF